VELLVSHDRKFDVEVCYPRCIVEELQREWPSYAVGEKVGDEIEITTEDTYKLWYDEEKEKLVDRNVCTNEAAATSQKATAHKPEKLQALAIGASYTTVAKIG